MPGSLLDAWIMWGLRQQRGTYFIPPPSLMPHLEIYILSLAALFRSAYSPFQHFRRMRALHRCINLLNLMHNAQQPTETLK
jgi:hypothetical protein